jgi:hypothetical protein
MDNPNLAMAGAGGCYLVADTYAINKNFRNAVVVSDAVINTITDNKGNSKTEYNFGTSTLAAGTLITCQGDYFNSIDLTSGSIMLYLY